jgi:hypothetical protein
LLTTTSIETVRAGEKGLSLADLAGSYPGKGGGFLTLCFTSNFISPAACADPSSVAIPFNDVEVAQLTRDQHGKFCETVTEVASPVGTRDVPDGFLKAPAVVIDFIVGGSTTSYDPRTGRGTITLTFYNAAEGVSCEGATVVNPSGAQPVAHGTIDFAAGEAPTLHFDYAFTSLTAVAGNYGDFVSSGTLYIQNNNQNN